MTTLPSSGTHWIEPAASGAASVATPIKITETSADVFEFVSTGTPAEIIRRAPGVLEIVSEFSEYGLVEAPAGTYTPTPGASSTTVLVESPVDTFTVTPGGAKTGQLFGNAAGRIQIVSTADSVRATVLAVGSTNIAIY